MTTNHKVMAEIKDLEDVVGHKEMKMSREWDGVLTWLKRELELV